MRIFLLFLSLVIAPYVVRGQEGLSSPSTRTDGVAKRGDHVMGFSHEAATHHFYLFTDGGEIVVTANVPVDASTRDQIRAHLAHIAKMFAAGDFNAPMLIHDTNPPGTATMSKRKEQIQYKFLEVEGGAKIRITGANPETIDAVHAFLLFQILDHRTGDSAVISDDHTAK